MYGANPYLQGPSKMKSWRKEMDKNVEILDRRQEVLEKANTVLSSLLLVLEITSLILTVVQSFKGRCKKSGASFP